MTTTQLIILRLYMVSLGRLGICAKILRYLLVSLMIKSKKNGKYNASSKFFNIRELES